MKKALEDKEAKIEAKTVITAFTILFIGLAPAYLPAAVSNFLTINLTSEISLSGLSLAAITGITVNILFSLANRRKVSK